MCSGGDGGCLCYVCAVVVMVDASDKWMREKLQPELLHSLSGCRHIPAVLVLNKVSSSSWLTFLSLCPVL